MAFLFCTLTKYLVNLIMKKLLLLILTSFPLLSWAQFTVTGKIIDLYTKKPIVKASVFLSNTTVGSSSGEDGSYTLSNVKPGQYDMVISAVGYETFYRTINVNKNLDIPYTELTAKTIALNAVVVKPDGEWQQNYTLFKAEFLGASSYALECKILNPEVLDLTYNKAKQELTATSSDYLIIENKALGYNLRYLLTNFNKDYMNGQLYYQGNVLFEPMKGSKGQMKKWYKNRLDAYQGSIEHYLRSIVSKTTAEESFKTLRLKRILNPDRPADSIIQAKLRLFRPTFSGKIIKISDSLNFWSAKNRLPKINQYLSTKPINIDSLIRKTDQKGILAITFDDVLYVLYTKKKNDDSYINLPLNAPNNLTSLMSINAPYAFFDNNGVIINPADIIFEGSWGTNRTSKLLPVDYDPHEKDKQAGK